MGRRTPVSGAPAAEGGRQGAAGTRAGRWESRAARDRRRATEAGGGGTSRREGRSPAGAESMTEGMTNIQRMKNRGIYLVKAFERYFVWFYRAGKQP